ncbi:hypothetical protein GCM10009006_22550 [Haloarcula argentinensis]|uniref:Uncharacterized protein n=2 Tax=Haloarcula argentinensis TaxID=43776 RepID=A0A830FVT6_HALAR|nr:hypothetical protein GCM10009006_22550 [Haloarcula argentinensis]
MPTYRMATALPAWFPDRAAVTNEFAAAIAVGATLYLVDGALSNAVIAAAAFFALRLFADALQAAVGDYAGNAFFGLLVLAVTGYAAVLQTSSWTLAAGVAVGGWFVIDGIQHLRHGVTRDEVGVPYSHGGGPVTGLPKALLVRLAEPLLV